MFVRPLEGLLLPRISGMCRHAPILPVSRTARLSSSETKAKKKQFIESIVSQNTRGLKSDDRIHELFTTLTRRKIFAACIQETWRTGKETLEYEQCRLILSGLDSKVSRCRRGEQGVGIALSRNAVAAWKAAGSLVHDDFGGRIIAVRLLVKDDRNRDVGIFLVSAYAPVGRADQSLWDDYMENLDTCISRKVPNDILVIPPTRLWEHQTLNKGQLGTNVH